MIDDLHNCENCALFDNGNCDYYEKSIKEIISEQKIYRNSPNIISEELENDCDEFVEF
jgi:hypothetical protein